MIVLFLEKQQRLFSLHVRPMLTNGKLTRKNS